MDVLDSEDITQIGGGHVISDFGGHISSQSMRWSALEQSSMW